MKAVATEMILIAGVLVATGIVLFQLKGIFFAQQEIAGVEVVVSFARDLESIVDRAIATTGDASFIYYPRIKKYSVDVSSNTVSVFDKLSNETAAFSKLAPELIDIHFEDCEKIFIIKKEEKIVIICECLENEKVCTDSLQCCSGYCNETSKKCELPPVCPVANRCPGAPMGGGHGNHAWKDAQGNTCCPLNNIDDTSGPVCDKNHCCPTHKPKWCSKPKTGEPRCMSSDELTAECVVIRKVYHLVFVPIGYGNDYASFKRDAEQSFDFFLQKIPLRECSDARDRIEAHIIRPGETPECQISSCSFICSDCNSKALACAHSIPQLRGKINKVAALCRGGSCPGACGCANGIPGTASSTNMVMCRGALYEIPSHEIGHTMGLGHVDCDVACHACPPYANNCNCPDCSQPMSEKRLFIMDYCNPFEKYGPAAYQCLKNGEFKNYMC